MSPRFDAVLFDAGGVFILPDPVAMSTAVAPFGGDSSIPSLMRAHYAGMANLDRYAAQHAKDTIDSFSWEPYREAYMECVGVPPQHRVEAQERARKMFSPFLWRFPIDDSVAALWRLHRHGLPIGIVSNASGQVEATLAAQCVCQVGSGAGVPVLIVTDSHAVGVAKPHPGVFANAIALLNGRGIATERIAYVGDSYVNDVGGARNAGLHPLLLDPYDDHADFDCERITSVHDVIGFV